MYGTPHLLESNMKRGIVRAFIKPVGEINGLRFHTDIVHGTIENGMEVYYEEGAGNKCSAVYGFGARIPKIIIEEKIKPKLIPEIIIPKEEHTLKALESIEHEPEKEVKKHKSKGKRRNK